eukprot:14302032-Ditylum_brightwellii.AAC.1
MIGKNIALIPATIDPFQREGSAIQQFWHSNDKKPFGVDCIRFNKAKGVRVGKEMCTLAMNNTRHCGILRKAS